MKPSTKYKLKLIRNKLIKLLISIPIIALFLHQLYWITIILTFLLNLRGVLNYYMIGALILLTEIIIFLVIRKIINSWKNINIPENIIELDRVYSITEEKARRNGKLGQLTILEVQK